MAARIDHDITVPQSTGQVETPGPFTVEQPADAASSDAVPFDGEPVTSKFGPSGQQPTGHVETPGPVSYENPVVKVVKAPARHAPHAATTAETPQQPRQVSNDSDGR